MTYVTKKTFGVRKKTGQFFQRSVTPLPQVFKELRELLTYPPPTIISGGSDEDTITTHITPNTTNIIAENKDPKHVSTVTTVTESPNKTSSKVQKPVIITENKDSKHVPTVTTITESPDKTSSKVQKPVIIAENKDSKHVPTVTTITEPDKTSSKVQKPVIITENKVSKHVPTVTTVTESPDKTSSKVQKPVIIAENKDPKHVPTVTTVTESDKTSSKVQKPFTTRKLVTTDTPSIAPASSDTLKQDTPTDSSNTVDDEFLAHYNKHIKHLSDIQYYLRLPDDVFISNTANTDCDAVTPTVYISLLRLSLVSEMPSIRILALQCLRLLLLANRGNDVYDALLTWGVDVLLTRCMDIASMENDADMELVMCMRIFYVLVKQYSAYITLPLIAVLVSVAFSYTLDNKVFRSALAILAMLGVKQPLLIREAGGVRALVQGIMCLPDLYMNESLVLSISCLLSYPYTRGIANPAQEFQQLLAPFTDPIFVVPWIKASNSTSNDSKDKLDRKNAIQASILAFVSLMGTWSGLFTLQAGMKQSPLSNFLNILPIATPTQQEAMLDGLYRILLMVPPVRSFAPSGLMHLLDSTSANSNVSSSFRSERSMCRSLSLMNEDWLIHDLEYNLTPINKSRTDLALCYRMLVMTVLMEHDILIRVLELAFKAPEHLVSNAIILGKEILLAMHRMFPVELHVTQNTDLSINNFFMNSCDTSKRYKISLLLQKLYLMERDEERTVYSPFTQLLFPSTLSPLQTTLSTKKEELALLPQIDRIAQSTESIDYTQYDWGLINTVFSTITPSMTIIKKLVDSRVIDRLIDFYKPSSKRFCKLPLDADSDQYLHSMLAAIRILSTSSTGQDKLKVLYLDIINHLNRTVIKSLGDSIFNDRSVSSTVTLSYFIMLGRQARTDWTLLEKVKYPSTIMKLFSQRTPNKTLVKLILPTLVYTGSTSKLSFHLLRRVALCPAYDDIRLFCVKFLLALLRALHSSFPTLGIKLLCEITYDSCQLVSKEAISALDEALQIASLRYYFFQLNPECRDISEPGYLLIIRLFSIEDYYLYFQNTGYLDEELVSWQQEKNLLYVKWVEVAIAEGFSHYKELEPGQFERRSTPHEEPLSKKRVHPPVHLYGQLAAHKLGRSALENESVINPLVSTLKKRNMDNDSNINVFKSVLWALGNIGAEPEGIDLLLTLDIIEDIIDICYNCSVLTVKGTAYYVLCMLAKTPLGADALLNFGWFAVRHGNEQRWPLAKENMHRIYNLMSGESLPKDESATNKSISGSNILTSDNQSIFDDGGNSELSPLTSSFELDSVEGLHTSFHSKKTSIDSQVSVDSLSRIYSPKELDPRYRTQSTMNLLGPKKLAVDPNASSIYLGITIPINLSRIFSLKFDDISITTNAYSAFVPSQFDSSMKRDPSVRPIAMEASLSKFRSRTHTDDSAISSQSFSSKDQSPKVEVSIPVTSPQKETTVGSYVNSEQSSAGLSTQDNLLEAVALLNSQIAQESKKRDLIKIKAIHPNLFTDLQVYLQVVVILSNYRFTWGNRKFIQALFDQNVFDSLYFGRQQQQQQLLSPDRREDTQSSLTPELLAPEGTEPQDEGDNSNFRRRCSTGEVGRFRKQMEKNLAAEVITDRLSQN